MSPMAPPKAVHRPRPDGPVGGDLVTDGGFLCQNCKAKAAKETQRTGPAERQEALSVCVSKIPQAANRVRNVLCQFVDSETRMRCREFSKLATI